MVAEPSGLESPVVRGQTVKRRHANSNQAERGTQSHDHQLKKPLQSHRFPTLFPFLSTPTPAIPNLPRYP
jgi:hypothetical protein